MSRNVLTETPEQKHYNYFGLWFDIEGISHPGVLLSTNHGKASFWVPGLLTWRSQFYDKVTFLPGCKPSWQRGGQPFQIPGYGQE